MRRHPLCRAVLWSLATCIALELVLRLFGYGAYVQYRPDNRLLWLPEPGRHLVTVVNHQPITINDNGFRYPDNLGPKQAGDFRIFSFGDSVTMGWGVDDQHHYSAVLQQLLSSDACSGRHVQVISAGVNAYPNSLVVERLKTVLADHYDPDIVILAYSFNTGFERLATLQGAARQSFLRRVELKSLARRSALYNFLIEDLLRQAAYYRFRELLIQGSWDTAKQRRDENVGAFTAGLQKALAVCKAHKVQLVLLLLSSEGQVSELHPFQQAMMEFAQHNKIPIVNMVQAWQNQSQQVLFMDHVHPSARGHQEIAQELARLIRGLSSYSEGCQFPNAHTLAASTKQNTH